MAFILTSPQAASSSSNDSINSSDGVINASSTLTIDSVDTSVYNTVKWFIEITDIVNSKMQSLEVYAINRFTTVSHNKTNMIGDKILFIEAVVINGSNINLNITNNESVNLNYKFVRIQL